MDGGCNVQCAIGGFLLLCKSSMDGKEEQARADLCRALEEGEKLKDFETLPVLTEPGSSSAYRLHVFVLYSW